MISRIPASLLSFSIAFAVYGLAAGSLRFWGLDGQIILPNLRYLILGALFFASFALIIRLHLGQKLSFDPWGFAAGLLLIFGSDWLCRPYNLFQGPSIRGEILLFAALSYALLGKTSKYTILGLPLLLAIPIISFFQESHGRLIFSDDHGSFFYRLTLLKQTFPGIPFYYPFWNAGLDARDFFATGSLNVFLPFSWLIYAFPLEKSYNYIVAFLTFAAPPLSLYFSAKILRMRQPAPMIAAILGASSSLFWYRWALKYGTMGFITSASLVPLNLALICCLFQQEQTLNKKWILGLLTSFSLMLLWSASGLVFIPIILLGILKLKMLLQKKGFLILAALMLAINLPWISVFWSVSGVSKFASIQASETGSSHARQPHIKVVSKDNSLKSIFKSARESAISTNPLIVLFALPGIVLLSSQNAALFGLTSLWLLFLGTYGQIIKPQLELDRMLVILAVVLVLPTSRFIFELFQRHTKLPNIFSAGILSLVLGFLITGPFTISSIARNRSVEHYYFADGQVLELADKLKRYTGTGRALFSGFVLHELNEGHLAPLTYFSGRSLIASSPFHNLWRYRQIIPKEYLEKADAGISEYLDLMNVSVVLAHESYWRHYFSDRPSDYEKIDQQGVFQIYRRKQFVSDWTVSGEIKDLSQLTNGLDLIPNSSEIVLKFNYYPFLESSDCHLEPAPISENLTLIKLTGCTPGRLVQIRAAPAYKRIHL